MDLSENRGPGSAVFALQPTHQVPGLAILGEGGKTHPPREEAASVQVRVDP